MDTLAGWQLSAFRVLQREYNEAKANLDEFMRALGLDPNKPYYLGDDGKLYEFSTVAEELAGEE